LSGFFGLMAIETSAGLIAEGSVTRTICCADAVAEKITSSDASLAQCFMEHVITRFSGFRYTDKHGLVTDLHKGIRNQSA